MSRPVDCVPIACVSHAEADFSSIYTPIIDPNTSCTGCCRDASGGRGSTLQLIEDFSFLICSAVCRNNPSCHFFEYRYAVPGVLSAKCELKGAGITQAEQQGQLCSCYRNELVAGNWGNSQAPVAVTPAPTITQPPSRTPTRTPTRFPTRAPSTRSPVAPVTLAPPSIAPTAGVQQSGAPTATGTAAPSTAAPTTGAPTAVPCVGFQCAASPLPSGFLGGLFEVVLDGASACTGCCRGPANSKGTTIALSHTLSFEECASLCTTLDACAAFEFRCATPTLPQKCELKGAGIVTAAQQGSLCSCYARRNGTLAPTGAPTPPPATTTAVTTTITTTDPVGPKIAAEVALVDANPGNESAAVVASLMRVEACLALLPHGTDATPMLLALERLGLRVGGHLDDALLRLSTLSGGIEMVTLTVPCNTTTSRPSLAAASGQTVTFPVPCSAGYQAQAGPSESFVLIGHSLDFFPVEPPGGVPVGDPQVGIYISLDCLHLMLPCTLTFGAPSVAVAVSVARLRFLF